MDEDELRLLRVARSWRVSPRRFLGFEPAQTIVFGRDDAGRIATAKITTEPEWSDEDRRLALELEDYEARLCPGCGGDLEETTATENHEAYEPLPAIVCFRCKERQRLETDKKTMREKYGDALQLNVRKKTDSAGPVPVPAESPPGQRDEDR